MGRFKTEVLAGEANVMALADLSGRWIDVVHARRPTNVVVLDMDSSVSPTHAEQEGTAYNSHFGCTCYHPLFVFNQFGDLERCSLRSGNVHSADGWRDVLEPVGKLRPVPVKITLFCGPSKPVARLERQGADERASTRKSGCTMSSHPAILRSIGLLLGPIWEMSV